MPCQMGDDDGSGGNETQNLKILRVIRTLRLIKLVRLVRASRLIRRWQSRISTDFGTLIILKCLVLILLSSHWFACLIRLQVRGGACMQVT